MGGGITSQSGIRVGTLAIFGLIFAAHVASAAILADTPRAEFGCELSENKVAQGITAALISRGWSVTKKDSDGKMVAQIIVRGRHTLVVDIAYGATWYDVTYKSSDNLKYKDNGDGTATIHGNANKWLRNIHQDIAKQLVVLCVD